MEAMLSYGKATLPMTFVVLASCVPSSAMADVGPKIADTCIAMISEEGTAVHQPGRGVGLLRFVMSTLYRLKEDSMQER